MLILKTERLAAITLGLIMAASIGLGQEQSIVTIDEALDDDIESMDVHIEFSLGEIKIERGNPTKSVTGFIQYNAEMIEPNIEYHVSNRVAVFRLETEAGRESWGFSKLRNFDEYESPESELYFTPRIPLDFDFSCGLGEADLDFGDLKISDASIDNGLGETTINFSTPNSVKMRRLSVDNGLGELSVLNLSNANTGFMSFESGLGEALLDFGGEISRDMQVIANIGLGSMTFKIPEHYNVELDAEENFLSSIDADGMMQIRNGLYRSYEFKSSNPTIYIKASIGLGSIEIVWID